MKLIKSIVRPNKVDEVKAALEKLQISGMTVTEVRGHGKQKGHTAIYRGQEYNVSLLPKMEVEVVVPDSMADDAIRAIIEAARTEEIGDGRVFVIPVGESYRIRAGEKQSLRIDSKASPKLRCTRRGSAAGRSSVPCRTERRQASGRGRRLEILDDEHLLTWPDQAKLSPGELLDRPRIAPETGRLVAKPLIFRPLMRQRG